MEGTVVKEIATPRTDGTGIGNYMLTVDTNEGLHIITVLDTYSDNPDNPYQKPLDGLAEALEEGDRVRFQTNYRPVFVFNNDSSYFSSDRIGSIPRDKIWLINKKGYDPAVSH